nr:MAG: replication initiator protein [Microvirus sp.]
MKCARPVRFYRDDRNNVHHNSSRYFVKSEGFHPCGYCIHCRIRQSYDKAIRMVHESKFHDQSCFLTLTYSDDKLPPSGSLNYLDVTNFIKRLRRSLESTKYDQQLSYYRVGEYGSKFSRPHYHMVLFGYDFSDPIEYKGVLNAKTPSGRKSDRTYYKSSFATDCWSHGFVDIGSVDFSTCMYTAKYVTKKLYGSSASAYGSLESERSSSSKKSPIGLRWIQKYYSDVYPGDFVLFEGKKFPPPRFYDSWLEKNHPSLFREVKRKREDSSLDMYPDYRDLHAKHVIAVQKQRSFLRDGCAPNLSVDEALLERSALNLQDIAKGHL